uniref:RuvC-like resolvase n=1 Tax=Micrococcus phage Kurnik TaxID=3092208 RepID=A0AAU6R657_9CAUD
MTTAIIAVDPGKNSGVAEVYKGPDGWVFDSWELGVDQFFAFIEQRIVDLIGAGYEVRLVAESFLITIHTAKNTQAGWSLEMIGVLKFLAYKYGLGAVTMQAPNIGKTFGTNGKLKYLGWFKSGTAGHANDAARHLATFAAQRSLVFTKDQLIGMAQL